MNLDLKSLTDKVCHIAKDAGRFLIEERKTFTTDSVEKKQAHDYVSYVDKQSEQRIVESLSCLLPQAGFIAEEGSATYHNEPYCWVIDPLDGTTNYIHNNTPYCVCIALRDKDKLLLGVVYDPSLDECFYGWKQGGAYLNGIPMHTSGAKQMEDALLVVELPYNSQQYAGTGIHLISSLYGKVGGIRMTGSAALSICYVAAGRFDAWAEAFIGKWDYSAAALLVQEAGGRVTDFYGNTNYIEGHHIIATNGHLHAELQRLIGEELPKGM